MSNQGWFDIQVNGYGGIDFNQDDLTAEGLHRACEKLQQDGVKGILATIITESVDRMAHRLRRLVELRAADPFAQSLISGIHIEGPFLSPVDGYRGAHPLDAIRQADITSAERLLEAAGGLTRIFTLAPEQDPGAKVTRLLTERGIVVSAGHTNASLDQLKTAIDAGLQMFTHLGNGCPMLMPRHDNIIQRALFLRRHLWLCFIADGVHIPLEMLRNYLDLALPGGKCMVTTDAIAAAGLGAGRYRLGRWDLLVGEDLAVRSPDGTHLVGSAVSMSRSADNLARIGLEAAAIRALTSVHPRRALHLP